MINKLKLEFDSNTLNANMGSSLHGFIMQNIDSLYANEIHNKNIKPFNLHIYEDKKESKSILEINTLDEDSYENIIKMMILKKDEGIYLSKKNKLFDIKNIILEPSTSFEEIASNFYQNLPSNKITLVFDTSTAFKTNGHYHIMPDMDLILKSIVNKINHFSKDIKIDLEVIEDLTNYIRIYNYKLHSYKFFVEKVKINGFRGELSLMINGSKTIKHLLIYILYIANYTGIGIKTSLGMGGVRCKLM